MSSIDKKNIWVCKKYLTSLKKIAPNLVKKIFLKNNDVFIKTSRNNLNNLLFLLKNHILLQYKTLVDIVGYDLPSKRYRFLLTYCLLSKQFNSRVYVSICCNAHTKVNTVTNLYPVSNWFEREVWDMFGVFFIKHPDLRRILTDYGFSSHPLRKDFPLTGYREVFYSDKEKRVVYSAVENTQAYRVFSFKNPWEKN